MKLDCDDQLHFTGSASEIEIGGQTVRGPICETPEKWCHGPVANFYARHHIDEELRRRGLFYRWTNNTNEHHLAKTRTLRPSRNHRTQERERGLSVATGLWFIYYSRNRYGYLVRGRCVGTGADGEPLLDHRHLRPASRLMPRETLLSRFFLRNAETIAALSEAEGVSVPALFWLVLGEPDSTGNSASAEDIADALNRSQTT
jgi:hypothetical protein